MFEKLNFDLKNALALSLHFKRLAALQGIISSQKNWSHSVFLHSGLCWSNIGSSTAFEACETSKPSHPNKTTLVLIHSKRDTPQSLVALQSRLLFRDSLLQWQDITQNLEITNLPICLEHIPGIWCVIVAYRSVIFDLKGYTLVLIHSKRR